MKNYKTKAVINLLEKILRHIKFLQIHILLLFITSQIKNSSTKKAWDIIVKKIYKAQSLFYKKLRKVKFLLKI